MDNQIITEGSTNAKISYLTIIGLFVAYILNKDKQNTFTNFHIRQNIGLNIIYLINHSIIKAYFGWIAFAVIGTTLLILWLIGFMGVLRDEKKLVPIFGEQFQQWFKSI